MLGVAFLLFGIGLIIMGVIVWCLACLAVGLVIVGVSAAGLE